jgi:hypothetical protein
MHKLESIGSAPMALTVMTVESAGSAPAISISTAEARKQIEGKWVTDELRLRQTVTFLNSDGEAVSIEGLVEERDAVEIAGAYKVVMGVVPSSGLTTAYARGDRSREFVSLSLVRVLEVWGSKSAKTWAANNVGNGADAKRSMDMGTGKVA